MEAPALRLRLHWTALVAALLALTTLFLSEGSSYILPLLIAALIASAWSPYRLGESSVLSWMLRIALWGIVIALDLMRSDDPNNTFFDFRFNWLGELMAAELVIQAWRQRPEGGGRGVVTLLWSGMIFLIACDIIEDTRRIPYILYLAPAYMLFLVLSLPHFRVPRRDIPAGFGSAPEDTQTARRAAWMRKTTYAVAVLLALGLGTAVHHSFRTYRAELTYWGMRLFNEQASRRRSGLSTTPQLGATDNLKGSVERVLRIRGDVGDSHWRVMAFNKYGQGIWGPSRESRDYGFTPTIGQMPDKEHVPTMSARVTRLTDNNELLCAPLATVYLDPLDTGEMRWSADEGGPILVKPRAPSDYALLIGKGENYQGPFCAPIYTKLSLEERAKLLNVPEDIAPGVRQLAVHITQGITDPRARAEAIERYLITNYRYSLTYHPPPGDRVSTFLLTKGAAHCEYFAASAVILLRCVHIPARYVIGYYVHESDGPGQAVVRQRDAHAWAECWIEGRGWIVIDGTPGDGRPDALAGEVPPWVRAREWIQDRWGGLLDWLSGSNGIKAAFTLGTGAFLVLTWQWWRQRRRTIGEARKSFTYATPDGKMTALMGRFERLCRLRGLICPPNQTWQEYLASAAASAGVATGFDNEDIEDIEAASAFIRAYNAARFGPPPDRAVLDALESWLVEYQNLEHRRPYAAR
jgi:Transglutaminase-like superfamily